MQAPVRIEGRGPVAMALRLFLARQGFPVGAVRHEPFGSPIPDWLESRPLALSLGSWQLLSRIVALPPAAPIRSVEVSMPGRAGRTRMHAADLQANALGHVLRYGALHRSLVEALSRLEPRASRSVARGAHPAHTSSGNDEPGLGPALEEAPALVVVADGEPACAAPQSHDWRVHDFEQSALLAEVVAEHDAEGTAFECFTDEGPLALLPLPEARRYAIVWCARPERTAIRAALSAPEFDRELRERFGRALGALRVVSARHQTPLQRKIETRSSDRRRVAIGNAAQTLHPVAGQGMNLGLRDAFELAQCLGDARGVDQTFDEAIAHYRRRRLFDRAITVGITDALARSFTVRALAPFESIALGTLDLLAPARNRFARMLMFGLRSR